MKLLFIGQLALCVWLENCTYSLYEGEQNSLVILVLIASTEMLKQFCFIVILLVGIWYIVDPSHFGPFVFQPMQPTNFKINLCFAAKVPLVGDTTLWVCQSFLPLCCI
jgi:hypothetical protein